MTDSDGTEPLMLKIRTVTAFVPEDCGKSVDGWGAKFRECAEFLKHAKSCYEAMGERCAGFALPNSQHPCPPPLTSRRHRHCSHSTGYEVQTTRVATRVLRHFKTPEEALVVAKTMEASALRHGITFLSLGSTGGVNGKAFLDQPGALSRLATSLTNTSFTVAWQEGWSLAEARALATEIFSMAAGPNAAAGSNFRFAVAFNCPPGIPYFPVATAGDRRGFALGTENSALLHGALHSAGAVRRGNVEGVTAAIHQAFSLAMHPLEQAALKLEQSEREWAYLGIDSSVAPAIEPPDIAAAFGCLALCAFGESGTLAIAERITAGLKSLDLRLCGYCGLMLPVCEDAGLAAAAASGAICIQSLLQYSAVCGVGLDTVPVPGPAADATPEQRERLTARAAAVILDTAALSGRLRKPLTMRLLPVPGAAPGEVVSLKNPCLVEECAVMAL